MTVFRYSHANNMRLDEYLLAELPYTTKGMLYKYLRQNKIKLNDKKAPLNTRLTCGDEVKLWLPNEGNGMFAPPPNQKLCVLFEDDELLCVYKPAGISSISEIGRNSFFALVQTYLEGKTTYAALCHRLDTGTSGVILVAKTKRMYEFVSRLFREHRIQKTYYGVCMGQVLPANGKFEGYLKKNAHTSTVSLHSTPSQGAKQVSLTYNTIKESGQFSLLEITPHTGRTHQIRAQFSAAGHPLLGDSKYGDNKLNRLMRCRYQCLCAWQITFPAEKCEGFEKYANLSISCEKPWYYSQMIEENLQINNKK